MYANGDDPDISIHALTRSATITLAMIKYLASRFQSTHSQGVRLSQKCITTSTIRGFQSTHSQGVRRRKEAMQQIGRHISIHALTRSATLYANGRCLDTIYFNPRTHKECDLIMPTRYDTASIISIHALTRSATLPKGTNYTWDTISIHALTRSATRTH